MKHKWILISLSVVFVLTALTFYANRIILPTVIKKIAIDQAEKFLKRKVEIESLHFNWIRGVVIDHIKIYQKDSPDKIFAEAEKVSLGVIFIPGIKHHQLILPSVNIESPSFHLIHQPDGQWNFSDLLPSSSQGGDEKSSPVSVVVSGISISSGKLLLENLQPQKNWSEAFDQINLKIGFSFRGISFNAALSIPQKQGLISIDGSYDPISKSLDGTVNLKNIKPADYLNLLPTPLPLTLTSGTVNELTAKITYNPETISVQGHWSIENIDATFNGHNLKADIDASNAEISVQGSTTSVKGQFSLTKTQFLSPALSGGGSIKINVDDFVMNSPQDISIKASLQGDNLNIHLPHNQSFQGQVKLNIKEGRWEKDEATFAGDVSATDALIAISDDKNIKGDLKLNIIKGSKDADLISITTDLNINHLDVRLPGEIIKGDLDVQKLSISLDPQNNLKINGPINFNNLDIATEKSNMKGALHLKAVQINFDQNHQVLEAEAVGALADAIINIDQEKKLVTNAQFDLHTIYPLKNPEAMQYNGSLSIGESRLEGLPWGTVNNISGTFKADGRSLSWEDFSGTLKDKTITLTGHLTDFANPKIETTLSTENVDLKAEVNKNNNILTIKNITGHYLSAAFHTEGSVDLSQKIPYIDINSDSKFKLEDIPYFLPDLRKTLDPLKLSGLITATSSIKGTASDWKNWSSTTTLESDLVQAMGLKFNNLKIKLNQKDGKLKDSTINIDAYKGTISIIPDVDLTDSALPADVAVKIENIDVATLIKEFNIVRDIRGQFNLTSTVKTSLIKPLNITGKGNLSIKEAYLADIELFKGILSPLKTIIPSSNLILNEVEGNFSVADQKVTTDDLQFKGNIMNFLSKGSVGFDQSINMSIEAPDDSNQTSPIPSDLRQSIHYTVTGKISEPKVKHNFSEIKTVINIGKKILGDSIPQGISDMINQLPF